MTWTTRDWTKAASVRFHRYEVTGLTTWSKPLLAVGTLACFILPMYIFPLISTSLAWSLREIIASLLRRFFLAFWWYVQHYYSLEVDDNSVRAAGRVVRRGHVRYVREIRSWPWRGGVRLVLSERSPAWARLFGGVIVIPKGLAEYEQIKKEVFTWMAPRT